MEIKLSANFWNNLLKKNMNNMIFLNLSKFNKMPNYINPYLIFSNKTSSNINSYNKIDNLTKNLSLNFYMKIIPSLFFRQIKEYFIKNKITNKLEVENCVFINENEQEENIKEKCIMRTTTFKRKKLKLKKHKTYKRYKKIKNSLKKRMK